MLSCSTWKIQLGDASSKHKLVLYNGIIKKAADVILRCDKNINIFKMIMSDCSKGSLSNISPERLA